MFLKLVHPGPGARTSRMAVNVAFSLRQHVLIVRYQVLGYPPSGSEYYVNEQLTRSDSQPGLWDWDVVELFLATGSSPTYYEFIVSPLNQYFELQIFEPRTRTNPKFVSGFTHGSNLDAGWHAEMNIPLDVLGWRGDIGSLRGNAFAILGRERTYWSLFLPVQEKPDFHLPRYFRPLFR